MNGKAQTVIANHPELFTGLHQSQFHFVIIILRDMVGANKKTYEDTFSIPLLLSLCVAEGLILEQERFAFMAGVQKHKRTADTIGRLRGDYFGHKSTKHTLEDLSGQVAIKTSEIDELFFTCFRVLELLAPKIGTHLQDWERVGQRVKDDFFVILTALS